MAKSGRTFITFFLLSGLFLAIGIFLAANATADPPDESVAVLIAGATSIGFGFAMAYLGVKSYLHRRAVVAHISRRPTGSRGASSGKTRQEGDD